jgi:hypothetical protein
VTQEGGLDYLDLAWSLDVAGQTAKALAVLDVAVSRESRVAEALALKGDLLRSQGQLQEAAEVFDLLARREPDHPRARYLARLLAGDNPPMPGVRPAPWPSPFVRIENFLDGGRHGELLALVTSGSSVFEPSTVGAMGAGGVAPRVDVESRLSFQLTDIGPVARWLRELIAEQLPAVRAQLSVGPFAVGKMDLKCTAYGDGNFFAVHSDNLLHPTRRISFVYYFHHLPKHYAGGALLLFDGDPSDPLRYYHDRATRIETLDNSIVFFPSGSYHEVTRVVSPSGRFEDARFTFAGHVHVRADDTPPATTQRA